MKQKIRTGLILIVAALVFLIQATAVSAESETMFSVYENNRRNGVGNYVTEDFILLGHSLMMSELLAEVEQQVLAPRLNDLVDGLLAVLTTQAPIAGVTEANVQYLLVLKALITGAPVTDYQDEMVVQELGMIMQATTVGRSELMGHEIDYSRFLPRGRYTDNLQMERWFRAMTWAGSAFFPVVASRSTGITPEMADNLTARAQELAGVISGSEDLRRGYDDIDTLLTKVFGVAEDLNWQDYVHPDLSSEPATARSQLHQWARKQVRIPQISDGIVKVNELEDGLSVGDVLCGMRLFPRRFTAESAAMQKLVFPEVQVYKGEERTELPFSATRAGSDIVKGFPRADELMSLLGSQEALNRSRAAGDDLYEGYQKARRQAEDQLLKTSTLPVNIAMMRSWLTEGSVDNAERRLTSMLGYWTWGRYISLLFTKQSVTGSAKSFQVPDERSGAWIEPAVELYLWLQADMQRLHQALVGVPGDVLVRLEEYLEVIASLLRCAELTRAGYELDGEQVSLLNDLDLILFQLIGSKDMPIVVDIHTEPNSNQVLQEALGFARPIELVHGKTVLRGALFNHYEFKRNMSERMTDDSWLAALLSPETKRNK